MGQAVRCARLPPGLDRHPRRAHRSVPGRALRMRPRPDRRNGPGRGRALPTARDPAGDGADHPVRPTRGALRVRPGPHRRPPGRRPLRTGRIRPNLQVRARVLNDDLAGGTRASPTLRRKRSTINQWPRNSHGLSRPPTSWTRSLPEVAPVHNQHSSGPTGLDVRPVRGNDVGIGDRRPQPSGGVPAHPTPQLVPYRSRTTRSKCNRMTKH